MDKEEFEEILFFILCYLSWIKIKVIFLKKGKKVTIPQSINLKILKQILMLLEF